MQKNNIKIAIIGNSLPKRNYSSEIDSADFVVRFSKMDHFDGGLVGKKTDLLVVNPNVHFMEKGLHALSKEKREIYSKTKVLFRNPDRRFIQKIVDTLDIKKFGFFETNGPFQFLSKKYGWIGDGNLNTTTGILFIVYTVLNMPECQPYLYCFGYDGFFGPYEFEDEVKVVTSMAFNGKVIMVD